MLTADLIDVRNLYARYNFAIDHGDVEGWVSCFTDDGVFRSTPDPLDGGPHVGRESLLEFGELYHAQKRGHARHCNWNLHVTQQAADRADGMCSLVAFLGARASAPAELRVTAVYHDRLVKLGSGWRFAERHSVVDPQAPEFSAVTPWR